jgi:hypothetical protein
MLLELPIVTFADVATLGPRVRSIRHRGTKRRGRSCSTAAAGSCRVVLTTTWHALPGVPFSEGFK